MTKKNTIWNRLLDTILPRHCSICDSRLGFDEKAICVSCATRLPRTHYELTADNTPMTVLFQGIVPIEKAVAFVHFNPHNASARLIYAIKYYRHPDYAMAMGEIMAKELLSSGFFDDINIIVPVPLSRRRLHQRGYNQSEYLARGVSKITSIPVVTKALRRKHFLQSQTMLGHTERQKNVENMFVLRDASALSDRHILLIDDICTTGATAMACIQEMQVAKNIRFSILTLGLTDH